MSGKTAQELSKPKKYHGGDQISPVSQQSFSLGRIHLAQRQKAFAVQPSQDHHGANTSGLKSSFCSTLLNPFPSKELTHSKHK